MPCDLLDRQLDLLAPLAPEANGLAPPAGVGEEGRQPAPLESTARQPGSQLALLDLL